jgi:hypothetical protein
MFEYFYWKFDTKIVHLIIHIAWKQEPQERISFMKLLDMLEELNNSIRMPRKQFVRYTL